MKIDVITKCAECGWRRTQSHPYKPGQYCYNDRITEILNAKAIPDWCPLDDRPEHTKISYADFLEKNPNYGKMIEPVDGMLKRLLKAKAIQKERE